MFSNNQTLRGLEIQMSASLQIDCHLSSMWQYFLISKSIDSEIVQIYWFWICSNWTASYSEKKPYNNKISKKYTKKEKSFFKRGPVTGGMRIEYLFKNLTNTFLKDF